MEVMWIVLPMALGIAAIAVLVFIWSVRSGQFDDLVTPSLRILVDDDEHAVRGPGTAPRSGPPCQNAPRDVAVDGVDVGLDPAPPPDAARRR